MPGIFDVLAANGILNNLFGGQQQQDDPQAQANANQQSMMDILSGRQPVPQRTNNPALAVSNVPPAMLAQANRQDAVADMDASSASNPSPLIMQAMQNGGVPVQGPRSYDDPDTAQALRQAQINPATLPSGPDPFADTYNKTSSAFQGALKSAQGDKSGYGWADALIDAGRGLMIAGSPDPARAAASFADAWASERAGRKNKVTPLADGAFSMVTKPDGTYEIIRNDQIANYVGERDTAKFQQALQKVILGGQVNAQVAADRAAIKTGEEARPLLNDVTGMIDRWGQAKTIIEGQGVGAQIQGAFPGIAGFFGGDQVAANKFLEGLTVDETLLNTARTKGAISNQEMNLFKAPIPSVTDDREKVWKPWIEKRIEVLNKLKTFYEGEVARGAVAGSPAGSPSPTASPAPSPAPSGGPTRISSEADWANLPSGTQYIGPDGKLRTKR